MSSRQTSHAPRGEHQQEASQSDLRHGAQGGDAGRQRAIRVAQVVEKVPVVVERASPAHEELGCCAGIRGFVRMSYIGEVVRRADIFSDWRVVCWIGVEVTQRTLG